jgi:Uma2 family endonuclease
LLIIEVADTTARYDRDVKVPLYARQGIGEVWLVDLEAGRVEVYREPEQGAYRRVERLREGMLAPAAYPDVQVDIGALLA